MEKIEERPFMPTSIEAGTQAAYLTDLIRTLMQHFGRAAQRSNGALPADGSELQTMQSMSYTTLAEFTGDQNNLDIGSLVTIVRVSSNASHNVTGIDGGDASDPQEGRVLILMNVGTNNIVLNHEDVGSLVENRFKFAGAVDVTLLPDGSVNLWWDVTTNRWRRTDFGLT